MRLPLNELMKRGDVGVITWQGTIYYDDGTTAPAHGAKAPQCAENPNSNGRSIRDTCNQSDGSAVSTIGFSTSNGSGGAFPPNPFGPNSAPGGGINSNSNPLQIIGGVAVYYSTGSGVGSAAMAGAVGLSGDIGPLFSHLGRSVNACKDQLIAVGGMAWSTATYVAANASQYSAAIGASAQTLIRNWQGAATPMMVAMGLEFIGLLIAALGPGACIALLVAAGLTIAAAYSAFRCFSTDPSVM